MRTLHTIGYEGADVDRLIRALLDAGVDLVADVRAVAISRKRGFSKSSLKAHLEAAGIAYAHFVELGDPKPGRLAARAGRIEDFRSIYASHLRTPTAQAALDRLAQVARLNITCLLCYERDPADCHRSMIAARLGSRGFRKINLYSNGDIPANLPRLRPRQGPSTAEQEAR